MKLFKMIDSLSPAQKKRDARTQEQQVQAGYFQQAGAAMGGLGAAAFSSSSQPNIFGGMDYYQNGVPVGHSQPNIFGGQDYFGGGMPAGHTMPNIFGGYDYYG